MDKDQFLTIDSQSEGLYREKGSKFIAFAYPVQNEKESINIVNRIKKEYHDARHHCFAYNLGVDKKTFRINDDGEPSGTAGKPIYGQIISCNLTNIIIIVIRYFGGTKLGVSGLINAYRTAARDAINNSKIITQTLKKNFIIKFTYQDMNTVMRIVKEEGVDVLKQEFELHCKMLVAVRRTNEENFLKRFQNLQHVSINEKDQD